MMEDAVAISPPGDIVLNVARAADPDRVAAARARLAAHAQGAAPPPLETGPSPSPPSASSGVAARGTASRLSPTGEKFETMVLQNFMQALLPEDTGSIYGKGLAGDMWRSMLAQKLSETLAKRGGIGIADRVLGDYTLDEKTKVPIGAVSTTSSQAAAGRADLMSSALVTEIERHAARTLGIGSAHLRDDRKS